MHTVKITPNLLFEYQCTSGKFIRLPNRIESKNRFGSENRIESNQNFFVRIGMLYYAVDNNIEAILYNFLDTFTAANFEKFCRVFVNNQQLRSVVTLALGDSFKFIGAIQIILSIYLSIRGIRIKSLK